MLWALNGKWDLCGWGLLEVHDKEDTLNLVSIHNDIMSSNLKKLLSPHLTPLLIAHLWSLQFAHPKLPGLLPPLTASFFCFVLLVCFLCLFFCLFILDSECWSTTHPALANSSLPTLSPYWTSSSPVALNIFSIWYSAKFSSPIWTSLMESRLMYP